MIATFFQFGDCIGPVVEEYLVISSVYALIDYIILTFFLSFQADHRLAHICPEYGEPETMNLYGSEYDQSGIILWVWWQSMIDLFLYGRETRASKKITWWKVKL